MNVRSHHGVQGGRIERSGAGSQQTLFFDVHRGDSSIRISDIMPLIDQVQKDMVAAMKNREEARLSAIRMIKAALMKAKVDSPKPLDEAAEMALLKQLIKQRVDAAEMYRKAGRAEQAEKEEAERALIEAYLPAGATEAEIDAAVEAAMSETG